MVIDKSKILYLNHETQQVQAGSLPPEFRLPPCHQLRLNYLLSNFCVKVLNRVRLFATPQTIQSIKFSRPKKKVGSLSLLQGIFLTQGVNPGLQHCRAILYELSHKGSPLNIQYHPKCHFLSRFASLLYSYMSS